jgi:hypothetical protein
MPPSVIRLILLGSIAAVALAYALRSWQPSALTVAKMSYDTVAPSNERIPEPAVPQKALPAPAEHVDLSNPVYTRAGAIICPLDSFNSPLEGHAKQDLIQMFADPHDRRMHAAAQMCGVYQPHIQLAIPDARMRGELLEDARAEHASRIVEVIMDPDYLLTYVLEGTLQFRVTRMDEVTNTR